MEAFRVYAMWGNARSKFVNLLKINNCLMAYIAKTHALSVLMLFCPKGHEISQLRLVFSFLFIYVLLLFQVL